MEYPSIRLYYPGGKAGSFGSLAEGYLRAFRELGITHAALDYRTPPDEDGFGCGGASYDIGLYLGEPTHIELMSMHADHKERLVVIAPNGYGIPLSVVTSCKKHGVTPLAPSAWAAEVLKDAFGHEVEVARHGVHVEWGAFRPRMNDPESADAFFEHFRRVQEGMEKLDLLHFTSTATDRKGTLSLLMAFYEEGLSDFCTLEIKCDRAVADELKHFIAKLPYRCRREICLNMGSYSNNGELANYMDSFDAVVQPSRAEGFGLVPLEAASIGLPTVLTSETGHGEFFYDLWCSRAFDPQQDLDPGGEYKINGVSYCEIEGEPYPVGQVTPRGIAIGVRGLRDNIVRDTKKAIELSPGIRQRWSWTSVVKEWLEKRTCKILPTVSWSVGKCS